MNLDEFHKIYEVDHIVPISDDDSRDDDSNWAILHKTPCNRKKGNKPLFLARNIFNFEKDKKTYGDDFTLGKVMEIKDYISKP
ncbi:MAG: HNH endonuclease, partial [Candidatus Lokiarchaeota archaeon]|nr:HNH endonuclease [Candidatus Lokiarchaeota archaeon]